MKTLDLGTPQNIHITTESLSHLIENKPGIHPYDVKREEYYAVVTSGTCPVVSIPIPGTLYALSYAQGHIKEDNFTFRLV
jgi:hypothetical protein